MDIIGDEQMTREQAEQEYRKLLKDWKDEDDQIIRQAEKDGKWKPGLDSNRELFQETRNKYLNKIKQLTPYFNIRLHEPLKLRAVGYKEITEEEREKIDEGVEEMLRFFGVLKPGDEFHREDFPPLGEKK